MSPFEIDWTDSTGEKVDKRVGLCPKLPCANSLVLFACNLGLSSYIVDAAGASHCSLLQSTRKPQREEHNEQVISSWSFQGSEVTIWTSSGRTQGRCPGLGVRLPYLNLASLLSAL